MKPSNSESRITTTVTIENIHKNFGKLQALKGVSVDIQEKEFFTLLGPSGCGKTTLLRIIAGFERPEKGRILFNGKDNTNLSPWKKNIGFVFQNYALWPNKSVYKNIAYGLELRKFGPQEIRKKVKWALDMVELSDVEDKYPEEMSGGQQQRVAIARALVINPEILLLDEPLSNLDAKLRISLRKQMKQIQQKLGITAVYVTHDQEEALEISDRIAVMNKGQILQVGVPKEIYKKPADIFVADFIGKANFVEGKVKGKNFFLASGEKIPLPDRPDYQGEGVLFTRPEELSHCSEDTPNQFSAIVSDHSYLGNISRYTLSLQQQSLLIEANTNLSIGEKIYLKVNNYAVYPKN